MFQAAAKVVVCAPSLSQLGECCPCPSLLQEEPAALRVSEAFQGLVRSVRSQKENLFLSVNDGSSLQPLQITFSFSFSFFFKSRLLTFGSAIEATGCLKKSPNPKQPVELQAERIHVVGKCNPVDFPFKIKERHGLEYIRHFLI
uniref:OB domain-containing protein n=1 Tax=Myripristis murdjan TaxID=586833 RepID=A0A667Z9H5_9TELE